MCWLKEPGFWLIHTILNSRTQSSGHSCTNISTQRCVQVCKKVLMCVFVPGLNMFGSMLPVPKSPPPPPLPDRSMLIWRFRPCRWCSWPPNNKATALSDQKNTFQIHLCLKPEIIHVRIQFRNNIWVLYMHLSFFYMIQMALCIVLITCIITVLFSVADFYVAWRQCLL